MSTNTQAIPDEIMQAAYDCARGIYLDVDDSGAPYMTDDDILEVAKAIHDAVMAERERCARIADDEASGRDWQRADANAQNDKRAARDFESMKIEAGQIASAIRAAPKAEG